MADPMEEGEASTSNKKFGEFASMEDFTKVIFVNFMIHAFNTHKLFYILRMA